MACSTVSHEKALHNYFIPCINLRKTYGNFGKSSEVSANFLKLRKRFKPVFEDHRRFMKLLENFGNSSKVFSRCFYYFLKFSENLRKSSEKLRNGSKVIFRFFFLIFFNFRKIFGNLRKRFPDVIRIVRNGSQELKGFGARF